MARGLRILGACACGTAVSAVVLAIWHGHTGRGTQVAPVQLVVSGDTAGWIVPCGCTSNQSGGLPRRGTFVRSLAAAGPVILADAGGAVDGESEYHRIKFEAILRGEMAMGLAAHNIGGAEAALGPDVLKKLAAEGAPFVSANVRNGDGGAPLVTEPLRIVRVAGRRFALTGVLSIRYAHPGVFITDAREGVLTAIAAARGQYDSLIVLAYMPEEELRAFAAGLPEADVVVGGPTGQSIAPTRVGPTLLASATNKGKFVVRLTADTSARWSGTVVELDQSFADDAEQQANVRRYLEDLGQLDIPAGDSGLVPFSVAGVSDPGYKLAGTAACQECHQADAAAWAGSQHAHAWETLVARGYHVDPFCQQCHTTGFALLGGFVSANRSPGLRDVGCESCHGPAQAHVRDPKVRTPFAARDQCVRCHDRENSPTFAYEPFWEKIRHGVRGGGRP